MTDLTLNDLGPVIKRAAKSVAFQWPGVIVAEDVEQSIFVHLLERPNSISKIEEMDERSRYRAIVGVGHQIASQERTDYDHFKGSYRYSVSEVKDLLKQGVLTDPPEHFKAEVIDLLDALDELVNRSPRYAEAINSRYADDAFPTSTSEKDALKNGLTALAGQMNKQHRTRYSERDDGLGTREVINTARALDVSGSEWDGDDT